RSLVTLWDRHYRHPAPDGACGLGQRTRTRAAATTPHRHGHQAEFATARPGGFEPETLGCGMAFELLETAAQARAVRCGRDAQSVTLVIRRGPGSDVGKWDGGGLRFRAGGHLEG